MSDELASINGIKPNRLLEDEEEVEAKSQPRCVLNCSDTTESYNAYGLLVSTANRSIKSSAHLTIITGMLLLRVSMRV